MNSSGYSQVYFKVTMHMCICLFLIAPLYHVILRGGKERKGVKKIFCIQLTKDNNVKKINGLKLLHRSI